MPFIVDEKFRREMYWEIASRLQAQGFWNDSIREDLERYVELYAEWLKADLEKRRFAGRKLLKIGSLSRRLGLTPRHNKPREFMKVGECRS